MISDLAELICEALHNESVLHEIRYDYSGRGMYGETTTGIVFDGNIATVLSAVIKNAGLFCTNDSEGFYEPMFESANFQTDSMGLSTIIY